jgi:hypothetical protein
MWKWCSQLLTIEGHLKAFFARTPTPFQTIVLEIVAAHALVLFPDFWIRVEGLGHIVMYSNVLRRVIEIESSQPNTSVVVVVG